MIVLLASSTGAIEQGAQWQWCPRPGAALLRQRRGVDWAWRRRELGAAAGKQERRHAAGNRGCSQRAAAAAASARAASGWAGTREQNFFNFFWFWERVITAGSWTSSDGLLYQCQLISNALQNRWWWHFEPSVIGHWSSASLCMWWLCGPKTGSRQPQMVHPTVIPFFPKMDTYITTTMELFINACSQKGYLRRPTYTVQVCVWLRWLSPLACK